MKTYTMLDSLKIIVYSVIIALALVVTLSLARGWSNAETAGAGGVSQGSQIMITLREIGLIGP